MEGWRTALTRLQEKITSQLQSTNGSFEWHDSVLVEAVTNGYWLLIENAHICRYEIIPGSSGLVLLLFTAILWLLLFCQSFVYKILDGLWQHSIISMYTFLILNLGKKDSISRCLSRFLRLFDGTGLLCEVRSDNLLLC